MLRTKTIEMTLKRTQRKNHADAAGEEGLEARTVNLLQTHQMLTVRRIWESADLGGFRTPWTREDGREELGGLQTRQRWNWVSGQFATTVYR